MKLSEFVSKSLTEAVKNLELKNYQVHTDKEGNVQSVELVYVPKDVLAGDNKSDLFKSQIRR